MAETLTAHYAWTKPDPGASANTWGTTLNATTDKIDAQVYTNQQAGVPIGTIMMWAGATAPTNWLLCDGSSLSTTGTYAALFAVCGYAFGGSGANFNLPNLSQRFPMGAGGGTLGATGGAASVTLDATMMPAHSHTINISDPGHAHGVYDPGHAHGVNQWYHDHGYSQTPHGHGISDPGHLHGSGLMKFIGSGGGFGIGAGINVATGQNTDAAGTGISIGVQYANINFVGQTSAISIQGAGTGIAIYGSGTGVSASATSSGGGVAHENRPPFVEINYIIRAT